MGLTIHLIVNKVLENSQIMCYLVRLGAMRLILLNHSDCCLNRCIKILSIWEKYDFFRNLFSGSDSEANRNVEVVFLLTGDL